MPRALITLALGALSLSACLRFGYAERALPAADGGKRLQPDMDASTQPDATSAPDASATLDAAYTLDASSSGRDAAPPKLDAAPARDAAVSGDAAHATDATTKAPDDAATTIDSGSQCTPNPSVVDYCTQLPALAARPTLDGILDCGPSLVDLAPIGWTSSVALPSDNHARYAAAWHPEGLYIYVEVDDPLLLPALASDTDPWCGDGVELFADADGTYVSAPDYDNIGAIQLLATSPTRQPGTELAIDARFHTRSKRRVDDWTDLTGHIKVLRDTGYTVEAFITAPDLDLPAWTLTAGNKVGFDIAINVSVTNQNNTQGVDCGYGLGQYYLRTSRTPCGSENCQPHSNAAAFCTAVLQ